MVISRTRIQRNALDDNVFRATVTRTARPEGGQTLNLPLHLTNNRGHDRTYLIVSIAESTITTVTNITADAHVGDCGELRRDRGDLDEPRNYGLVLPDKLSVFSNSRSNAKGIAKTIFLYIDPTAPAEGPLIYPRIITPAIERIFVPGGDPIEYFDGHAVEPCVPNYWRPVERDVGATMSGSSGVTFSFVANGSGADIKGHGPGYAIEFAMEGASPSTVTVTRMGVDINGKAHAVTRIMEYIGDINVDGLTRAA